MSIYNMLFQTHPWSAELVKILGLVTDDFGRFRDAWLQDDGEHGLRIVVLTRCGGPNRDVFQDVFDKLRRHPEYLEATDDSYDDKYALVHFRIPQAWRYQIDLALDDSRASDRYDKIVDNRPLKQRIEEVMAKEDA